MGHDVVRVTQDEILGDQAMEADEARDDDIAVRLDRAMMTIPNARSHFIRVLTVFLNRGRTKPIDDEYICLIRKDWRAGSQRYLTRDSHLEWRVFINCCLNPSKWCF